MRTAVICDFGGVLTTPLDASFAAWSSESGVTLENLGTAMATATEAHGDHPLFMLERGQITQDEFVRRVEPGLTDGLRLDTMTDVYFRHLKRNPGMIAYMGELRERAVRTALLTNNVREWAPAWRGMLPELDDLFEVVVDSAFVGMRKPEPEIYTLTVERLGGGVEPSDCVLLDDVAINCDAARELGMAAVVFETNDQARAEVEELLARP